MLGIGTKKTLQQLCVIRLSDSGGIRTHDPQLRRLLLYPAELRNHPLSKCNKLRETAFVTFSGAKVNKIYRTTKFLSPIIEILPVSGVVHRKKENPQVLLFLLSWHCAWLLFRRYRPLYQRSRDYRSRYAHEDGN